MANPEIGAVGRNGSPSTATIIIGAGPAGLTAAYELINRHGVQPIVLERTGDIGGLSKTVTYKGNRIDFGGHRFFSKSDQVMDWWTNLLPMQGRPASDDRLLGREVPLATRACQRPLGGQEAQSLPSPDPETVDAVMLVRRRVSRILFLREFFDYPVSFNWPTLAKLGWGRTSRIVTSYAGARLRPIFPERSLADFLTNRFGGELYRLFFKDYTEKVWGESCADISSGMGGSTNQRTLSEAGVEPRHAPGSPVGRR